MIRPREYLVVRFAILMYGGESAQSLAFPEFCNTSRSTILSRSGRLFRCDAVSVVINAMGPFSVLLYTATLGPPTSSGCFVRWEALNLFSTTPLLSAVPFFPSPFPTKLSTNRLLLSVREL